MALYRSIKPVNKYNGCDCWRTWFFKECERYQLFGVTAGNLSRIKKYKIGTLIYLEDAPYYKTNKHRICGPYKVVEANPVYAHEIEKEDNGKIIIYKDNNPKKNGPWFDKQNVTRFIKSRKFTYKQEASEHEFFPYRFSIKPHDSEFTYVQHRSSHCDLCSKKDK